MKERIFKAWGLSVVGLVIILIALYAFIVQKTINVAELVILITAGLGAIGAKKTDFIPKKDE